MCAQMMCADFDRRLLETDRVRWSESCYIADDKAHKEYNIFGRIVIGNRNSRV